jgi:peroxiredoxin Q/BCP
MELKAYRDKYAIVRSKGAKVVAVSLDDVATLKRFRESIGAPFPFLSDPDGRVSRLYAGVSLHTANRVTVDIDSDGTIAHVRQGLGALFPDEDIKGCPLHEQGAPDPANSI